MLIRSLILLACIGAPPSPMAGVAPVESTGLKLDAEVVAVPMDHAGGHIRVDVWIDGKGPYLFQVDTYASGVAYLDDDFAQEMGFPEVDTTINSDGIAKRRKSVVQIGQLKLGGATLTKVRAMVDDYHGVGNGGPRMCGLIGFAFFRDVLLTIDYPGNQLVLAKAELPKSEPHSIPYESTNGSPDVRLRIGTQEVLFGIDTGMAGNMMLGLADADRLELNQAPVQVGRANSVYTQFDVYQSTLMQSVHLAGHEIKGLEVLFFDPPMKPLIGRGLLKPYAVTFDQKQRRVRFQLPAPNASDAAKSSDSVDEGPLRLQKR